MIAEKPRKEDLEFFAYDDFNDAYIIDVKDTTDVTGYFSEEYVMYSLTDNETYAVQVDQDGGEKLLWCATGLVL